MRKFLRIALILSLFLYLPTAFPASAAATASSVQDWFGITNFQAGGPEFTPSFTPPPTDLSVNYLGQIFGTVGTVLHGTSGQMLGLLFKIFNIGVLVIAGIFLIYTITMTVINTAHEGEFMGRKWNSAWIAIRTVLGMGLLVPSATTGYSTIQVIVMWVVIQGAGFANMAWGTALNYLYAGGGTYTPPTTDTASMVDLVGNVLSMQVCMYYAQNVEQQSQKNLAQSQQAQQASGTNTAAPPAPTQSVTNFTPLFTIFYDKGTNQYYNLVRFPGNAYSGEGQQDNACGTISFGSSKDLGNLQADTGALVRKAAIQQVMLNLDGYARQIANQTNSNPNFSTQIQSAIVGAAADWINITLPLHKQLPTLKDALRLGYFKTAMQQGWIMAGRYYYAMGGINRQIDSANAVTVNITNSAAGLPAPPTQGYVSFNTVPQINTEAMSVLKGLSTANRTTYANMLGSQGVANYIASARAVATQVDQAGKVNLNIGSAGVLGFLLSPITSFLLVIIGKLTTAVGDPIIILQGFGYGFLATALALWLGGTIGVFAAGLAGSIGAGINPFPYALEAAVMAFIPTFTAFILIFFTMGSVFAFYVPLIPFIIFVFAAIGWMITVIEAMVAAPLVALGITHPEGHDLLGKADQAIMLLLSVFLRPVLMIIGLFAGMTLSAVVLRFLNSGFFGIVFDVGDFNLFAFVSVLIIYCTLVVTIVNQAFSLIYHIPDRVMRWIGIGPEQTSAPGEALQASKQGAEQYMGQVQSSMGAMGSESAKARLAHEKAGKEALPPSATTAKGTKK